ncbi:hypothetical protein Patl1_37509 [Pistacia atlantica]|nr:hypothetical protein Patl1_37509 [Pistacia atlantica]
MSKRNDCHSAKVYNGKEVRKKRDDAISKGRTRNTYFFLSSSDCIRTVALELNGFSAFELEDEDNGPSKEECIAKFKEMLKERGVAPFSKWEKELPKIVFDPRFKVC